MPYPMIQPPAPPDPLRSLVESMDAARTMTGYETDSRELARSKRVEAAMNAAKGDPVAAAAVLEKGGDFATAHTVRENAAQIRSKLLDTVEGRLSEHKDALGQLEEVGNQAQQHPELWQDIRPKVISTISALDPMGNLAAQIPEQYDPLAVRNGLTWVKAAAQATNQRLQAVQQAKSLQDQTKATEATQEDWNKIASNYLSVSPNAEDWEQGKTGLKAMGAPQRLLDELGDWKDDGSSRERARILGLKPEERKLAEVSPTPKSIDAAILEAHTKGDKAIEEGLIKLKGQIASADRDPGTPVTKDMIGAVVANPQIWGDLTPSVRDKMLGPLAQQNFDFSAAAGRMTQATRAHIEEWKQTELARIEKAFQKRVEDNVDPNEKIPQEFVDDLRDQQLGIENSYRVQMGMPTLPSLPPGWTAGAASAKPAAAAPVATPTVTPMPTPTPAPAPAPTRMAPTSSQTSADATAPVVTIDASKWNPKTFVRPDGTQKGEGFFGNLVMPNGQDIASEYSIANSDKLRDAKGNYLDYPSLVPTLTAEEVKQTLKAAQEGKAVPASVEKKAEAFALQRREQGKPLFAQPGEARTDLYPDVPRANVVNKPKTAAPAPSPRPAGAATKRTATSDDVKKVAARLGISEAAAKQQLTAAGVTVSD